MRVVIAGAGIAGLTAALSLHAAGITDVTVHEAVAELHPLGSASTSSRTPSASSSSSAWPTGWPRSAWRPRT